MENAGNYLIDWLSNKQEKKTDQDFCNDPIHSVKAISCLMVASNIPFVTPTPGVPSRKQRKASSFASFVFVGRRQLFNRDFCVPPCGGTHPPTRGGVVAVQSRGQRVRLINRLLPVPNN